MFDERSDVVPPRLTFGPFAAAVVVIDPDSREDARLEDRGVCEVESVLLGVGEFVGGREFEL